MASLPDPSSGGGSSFQQVVSAFLAAPGLPFASVLSAERIERVFAKYGNLFGERHIYSTAVGGAIARQASASDQFYRYLPICTCILEMLRSGTNRRALLTACCRNMLRQIAECGVANRPGRIEPRVIKRRCQHYKLMQEPREVLKARLLAGKDLQ